MRTAWDERISKTRENSRDKKKREKGNNNEQVDIIQENTIGIVKQDTTVVLINKKLILARLDLSRQMSH